MLPMIPLSGQALSWAHQCEAGHGWSPGPGSTPLLPPRPGQEPNRSPQPSTGTDRMNLPPWLREERQVLPPGPCEIKSTGPGSNLSGFKYRCHHYLLCDSGLVTSPLSALVFSCKTQLAMVLIP